MIYLAVSSGPDWRDDALCAETAPDAFFPDKGGSVREAKRICRRCAVQDECLQYALAVDPPPSGVWGGTSERDRKRMRQRSASWTAGAAA